MSQMSPTARLASPSSLGSPTQTEIQDTQSSHSERHQQYQSSQQQTPKTTEYKSNFKPFDQYVYNEITDSFVKQKTSPTTANNNASGNYLLIESTSSAAGGSNQDLHGLSSISPALEITSFEPSNVEQHFDVTKEPWYKEVLKRNEKANEYRFKSEVGHSSPLLAKPTQDDNNSTALSTDELSLLTSDEHHSATAAGAHSASSPAPTNSDELSSRRAYNFTPHHYKRDHLIATMANNNNFKLPKEQEHSSQSHQERSSTAGRQLQATSGTRNATATNSARPLTRTTAASRARSQNARTAASSATGSAKPEPASKSNQSSPVKSAAPRVATARTLLATARTPATTNKTSNGTRTATRPLTTSMNGASTRPSTAATRARTPTSSTTSATSHRPLTGMARSATSSSTAARSTTSNARPSTARAPTLSTGSRSSATRAPSSSTTGTITISSVKARTSPLKRPTATTTQTSATKTTVSARTAAAPARNSLSRASGSRTGSASASTRASNEPKSIKSKALADAGEKAAAALAKAALATTAVGVAASSGDTVGETPAAEQEDFVSRPDKQQESSETVAEKQHLQQAGTQNANYYLDQEPNLIITTTETGNMLADELARAEKAAQEQQQQEALRVQQASQQPSSSDEMIAATSEPEVANFVTQKSQEPEISAISQQKVDAEQINLSEELVNGLSGGIVSAEDTYEHSERDSSAEFDAQQAAGAERFSASNEQQHEVEDDQEPYSLMPTTFDSAARHEEEPLTAPQQYFNEAFKDEHDVSKDLQPLRDDDTSTDSNKKSGDVQYDYEGSAELGARKRSSGGGRHVEFDLNVQTKSADSLHEEPEIIESRSSAKLGSGQSSADEGEEVVKNENPAAAQDAEQPANYLNDEPYEHLEPEPETAETNRTSEEQAQDDRIDDDFEIIEKDETETKDLDANQTKLDEPQAETSEPEELEADEEAKEVTPAQEQTSEEPQEKKEPEPEIKKEPEEEKKAEYEEKPQEQKTDMLEVEEPPVTKRVDSHKLTEESFDADIGQTGRENKSGESADPDSVFVPEQDDSQIDDENDRRLSGANQLADQQPSFIDEHSRARQGGPVDRMDDDAGSSVNETSAASQDHEADSQLEDEDGEPTRTGRNELLMNVADLLEAEARVKEEMRRKSGLARQQSSSRGSLTLAQAAGEILLSANQLEPEFDVASTQQQRAGDNVAASAIVSGSSTSHEVIEQSNANSQERQSGEQQVAHLDEAVDSSSATRTEDDIDQEILSVQKLASLEHQQQTSESTDDLVNFGSITPTQERPSQHGQLQSAGGSELRDLMGDDAADQREQAMKAELFNKDSSELIKGSIGSISDDHEDAEKQDNFEQANLEQLTSKPQNSLYDELMDHEDDDEQLKLSNHLTNSDDDIILAPRNTKEPLLVADDDDDDDDDCFYPQKSGSRYNEGAGLSSAVLPDEEPVAKSPLMPEQLHAVSSTGYVSKLSTQRNGLDCDSDDDPAAGLDSNADPIDVAATLSPSSSVAEEMMLRLSRQASNGSGSVPKLAGELRAAEQQLSLDKDADTLISSGHMTAQLTSSSNSNSNQLAARDQICEISESGSSAPIDANVINNNNNNNDEHGSTDTTTTRSETEAETRETSPSNLAAAAAVQRKTPSAELEAGTGDRKETASELDEEQAKTAGTEAVPTN